MKNKNILKFNEFVNESKASEKKDKNTDIVISMLKDKPVVKIESETYPDQKDAYSLAGIKKYCKEKGVSSADVDAVINKLQNDKESDLKTIKIKNFHYNEMNPHFYIGLTEDKVKKVKDDLEAESKEMSKPEIAKKDAIKKKVEAIAKEKKEKKAPVAKKATAKKDVKKPTKK